MYYRWKYTELTTCRAARQGILKEARIDTNGTRKDERIGLILRGILNKRGKIVCLIGDEGFCAISCGLRPMSSGVKVVAVDHAIASGTYLFYWYYPKHATKKYYPSEVL